GNDAILITNGSSEDAYQPYVNGRMFESFPTPWEGRGRWEDILGLLLRNQRSVHAPDVFFINSNTNDSGVIDTQEMRFGLTSALLTGAFFGYDSGVNSHAQLWVFDEYDAYLGRAVDVPKDELNGRVSLSAAATSPIYPSVWSRDFQEGRVMVNATNSAHTILLGEDFEKIHGTTDQTVNDGRIVSEVTLKPRDGVVLLRPIESLRRTAFPNGSFVRVFDVQGQRKRSGFFAYTGATLGGEQVVRADIDHDGSDEWISANSSVVRVHDTKGHVLRQFYPYGESYTHGVNIAVGDLEGDGTLEIVTGTKQGGGPQVRIFTTEGDVKHAGFFAYGETFRGGVNIALGDMNHDGSLEIITGAGQGGGPHVRIFNKDGRLINPGFFAYDARFRGGVNVAAGDVNGDGQVDIMTGMGAGGRPTVRIFSDRGVQLTREFDAFSTREKPGVRVAAEDLDGDGIAEIMALTTDVFTLSAF
ncbi:VCBS repeat-containing protein, partial [Candidatus Uhrbacteria bacterium]|nr:VCBS repeat-containing protein [Candidatus Uhrbacteria bacterium]